MSVKYLPYEDSSDLLKVNSSKGEVATFLDSTLHQDFQRELNLRIEILTGMLEDPDLVYTGRDYDVFRGGKRAFTEIRNLFEDIYNGIIESQTETEESINE